MYTYRADVSRVVDGDTIDLAWIDLGFGVRLFPTSAQPLRVRFAHTNAYETSLRGDTTKDEKQLGLECKAWLAERIEGKQVRIRTEKDGSRGNFGRWLVWVWDDGQDDEVLTELLDESYNQQILDMGYGVPYNKR